MRLGYHCSHEQFAPRDLLEYAQLAEQAGFTTAMSSEHIAPWSVRQGNSGFGWAWLGAALQATEMSFGSLAIPGGWRYHPVVVAHAFATLAQMFPGRVPWIAAGSGEAMNEYMVGAGWPDKDERNARMRGGVEIIRALWRGETVTSDGLHKTKDAKLWTLPEKAPLIYGAALSEKTAGWLGEWADGLITVNDTVPAVEKIVRAFRNNGGQGKPVVLQLQISWDETVEQARANVFDQWRHVASDAPKDNLKTPEEFDAACSDVQPHHMDKKLLVTADARDIVTHIREYAALGFDEIYLHDAGRNQREFLALMKEHVMPEFK
ncbi:MAG: class F420-dependent oxidoreductase [Alphaproteobacteria bacterium]|nr:class F420-dependent oxidoreductase [Alphaproteobacteria bacterium]